MRFADPPSRLSRSTDEQRRALYDSFRGNVDELAAWMGRDLSAWDPAWLGPEDTRPRTSPTHACPSPRSRPS